MTHSPVTAAVIGVTLVYAVSVPVNAAEIDVLSGNGRRSQHRRQRTRGRLAE